MNVLWKLTAAVAIQAFAQTHQDLITVAVTRLIGHLMLMAAHVLVRH